MVALQRSREAALACGAKDYVVADGDVVEFRFKVSSRA